MEVRTIHYPLWHSSVQISAFIPGKGLLNIWRWLFLNRESGFCRTTGAYPVDDRISADRRMAR